MALKNVVAQINGAIVALTELPVIGPIMGRGFVVITYTGRRSGKTFSTPVNYRRKGDEILIGVAMPDKKSWWRNFQGEGAPISLRLNGVDRTGHAVTDRDNGRVTVRVKLDDVA
ncbi:nitroreductase/quinone reductase family protein [Nocardia sp. CDC153]|uniref:nitroreductase/quinone reductase family protein n=1 Tax=Nocardia sp. CDC153 TaxID=3112167 RepID=UPI002DB800B6|nr:nitroreductase/quinone reductase family protein [Nocardia sp. CDC153]MEC3952639.1 nitroreductase/quinone reductase family protein [Nocardia sp. CDC153]